MNNLNLFHVSLKYTSNDKIVVNRLRHFDTIFFISDERRYISFSKAHIVHNLILVTKKNLDE